MKALCTFIGLLLIGAVVAGAYLGGSELFSPSVHTAEADKLEAEAAAVRAQTAYEERKREIELTLAEQKAAAELQALQARRARQLELMEPIAIVGMIVGSIVAFTLTVAASYYFITKARAVEGQVPERGQAVHHKIVPAPPNQGRGRALESGRTPFPIDRAKVHPDDVTYDGFLAYFYDYILHPNRVRTFYRIGIAPEIEDICLAILTEAQIITWETNGHAGWILPRHIRGLADVGCNISRRDFYSLASSCRTLGTVEPLFLRSVEPQQEPSPLWWSR